jgi:hypothetical protein
MNLSSNISKHLKEVYFGKNWTAVDLTKTLEGITWETATTKIYNLNSIASLVYHVNYYVAAVIKVLEGGPLEANDKYSFDHPSINNQSDWDSLLEKTANDTLRFAELISEITNEQYDQLFANGSYGDYYRNIQGIIEHYHYHLGQIMIIKKLLTQQK